MYEKKTHIPPNALRGIQSCDKLYKLGSNLFF